MQSASTPLRCLDALWFYSKTKQALHHFHNIHQFMIPSKADNNRNIHEQKKTLDKVDMAQRNNKQSGTAAAAAAAPTAPPGAAGAGNILHDTYAPSHTHLQRYKRNSRHSPCPSNGGQVVPGWCQIHEIPDRQQCSSPIDHP